MNDVEVSQVLRIVNLTLLSLLPESLAEKPGIRRQIKEISSLAVADVMDLRAVDPTAFRLSEVKPINL